MPQVEVDPERLRLFASQLKGFADFVDEALGRIKGQVGHLSSTWRDQEFEAFEQQIAKTYLLMTRFTEEANRTSPLLLRDAEAIDEYVRTKP